MEWESDTTDLGSTQSCESSKVDLNQAMLLSFDESVDDFKRIKKNRVAELQREEHYLSDPKFWNSTTRYSLPSFRKKLEILGIKNLGRPTGKGYFYLENAIPRNTENLDESRNVDYESTLSLDETSFCSTDFTNSNKESFDGTYDESFYETDSSFEKSLTDQDSRYEHLADRHLIRGNRINERLMQSGSANRNCTYNLSNQQFVHGASSYYHSRYGNSLSALSYQNLTNQDLIPKNSANQDMRDRKGFDLSVEKEVVRLNSFPRQNSEKNFLSPNLCNKEGSTEQLSAYKNAPNRRLVYENELIIDGGIVTGNPTKQPIMAGPSTNQNSQDSRMESFLRLANQSFANIMSISALENFETLRELKILERSILENNGSKNSSMNNSFENTSERALNDNECFKADSYAASVSQSSELESPYYDFEGLDESSCSNLDSRNENLEDPISNARNGNGNSDSDFSSDLENQKFRYKSKFYNTSIVGDLGEIVDHGSNSAFERKRENFNINSRLPRNTDFKPLSQAVVDQKSRDFSANLDGLSKLHARLQKLSKLESKSKQNEGLTPRPSGIYSKDNNFGRIFKSKSLSPSNFPVESKSENHRGILQRNNAESSTLLGLDGEGLKFRSSSVLDLNQDHNFGQHSVPSRKPLYFSDTEPDNFNIVTTAIDSIYTDTGTVTMSTAPGTIFTTATNTTTVISSLTTTTTRKSSPNARNDSNNINKIASCGAVNNSSSNEITPSSSDANSKDSKRTISQINEYLIKSEEKSHAKSSKTTAGQETESENQRPTEETPLNVIIRKMMDEIMGEYSKRPEIPAVRIDDLCSNSENPQFLESESGNICKTLPSVLRLSWIEGGEFRDRLDLFSSLLSSTNSELDSWRRLTTVLETDESRLNSRSREVSDWSRSETEQNVFTDSDSYELSGECLVEVQSETSETSDNL